MDGRPWRVHASRVRIIETPGPVIEEIFDDESDERRQALPALADQEPVHEEDGWTFLYEQE